MSTETCVTPNTDKEIEQLKYALKHILDIFKDDALDITRALAHYKYILTHYKNNTMYDNNCREYIFNFLHPSCVALMERNHDHFWENNYQYLAYNMADEVTNCCKLLIQISVPLIKQNPKCVSSIIYYCLNNNCSFYTTFGHDWRESRGIWLNKEEMENSESWRSESIKVGSHVDYLLNNRWHYGEIINITDKQSDEYKNYKVFHIQPAMSGMYPDDGSFTHEWMLMESTRCQLTKPLTKSIQHLPHISEWRKDLNTTNNNRCQVSHQLKWLHAIIEETDPTGHRIKVKYTAGALEHIEWFPRESKRLKPFDTNANVIKIVEDDDDLAGDNIFAINRGAVNDNKLTNISFHLIEVLNLFGECGGFDSVLDLLSDSSFAVLSLKNIFPVLSNCFMAYSKSFSERFIPKLYEILIKTLESLNIQTIDSLNRNIFDEIKYYIGDLMCRYHSKENIRQIKEKWTLEVTLRQLYCGHNDVGNSIYNLFYSNYKSAHITSAALINWINVNNILTWLLGLTNVIGCKSDVLITGYARQCVQHNTYVSLDLLNLMQMWFEDCSNCELMENCTQVLNFMHSHVQLEEIHINMFYNAIMSLELSQNEQGMQSIANVIENTYHILGERVMSKFVDNFCEHKYVIETIKALVMFNKESFTNIVLRYLIDNEYFLDCLFDDIKYLKTYAGNCIDENTDESSINDKKLFITKHSYIQHVMERIHFVEYIAMVASIDSNNLKFEFKECHKDMLYLQFVKNALTKKERETAITMLKGIIDDDMRYPLCFYSH